MTCKAENIYYITLYREILQRIPASAPKCKILEVAVPFLITPIFSAEQTESQPLYKELSEN